MQSSVATESLIQSIWDASANRYLTGASTRYISPKRRNGSSRPFGGRGGWTVAGTVVLLYDHLMTLPDEYRFVWKAKKSFAKYAFLLNRYAVPSAMLLTLTGTSCARK